MALAGYKQMEFNAGDCVDSDDIIDLIQNTVVIQDELKSNRSTVHCQEIDCEAFTRSSEPGCCEIAPLDVDTTPLSSDSLITDKRIFMFRASAFGEGFISGSDGGGTPDFSFRYSVVCDYQGTETNVYSSDFNPGDPRVIYFAANCPRTATLKFCVEFRATAGLGDSINQERATASFCGAVLSIRDSSSVSLGSSGFYCPGEMNPECCQDKTGLYLASQNANALCRSFAENCDQQLEIVETDGSTTGELLIQQGLTGNTTWVTSGTVTICYRARTANVDGFVNIEPTISCGSTSRSCGNTHIRVPRTNQGENVGPIRCTNVPLVLCGTCREGDDLRAAVFSSVPCNEEPDQFVSSSGSVEVVSITTQLCTMLFTKADTSSLPQQSTIRLWDCLPVGPFNQLVSKIDALHEFACNRVPLNCDSFGGSRQMSAHSSQVLVPAQPWPPPTPPPRPVPDPAPSKRYHFNIRGCVYYLRRPSVGNSGNTSYARARIEISCGGNVIEEIIVGPWIFGQKGGSDRDQISQTFGGCFAFNECINCGIDQDLQINFFGETSRDSLNNWQPDQFVGTNDLEVFALCF